MLKILAPKYKVRAKNINFKEAKKSVDYYADVLVEQYINSVYVNGSRCIYFPKVLHGFTCSCMNQQVGSTSESNDSFMDQQDSDIEINYTVPLFGSNVQENAVDDTLDLNTNDQPDRNGTELFIPSLFGNAIDCGLCYRTGYVPGYSALGHVRYVYATHNITEIQGYMIDSSLPAKFKKLDDLGFVKFQIDVPPNYKSIKYQIFNNREPLNEVLILPTVAGTHEFVVSTDVFTHIVVMFDISGEVLVDFPQDQRSLDLTMFDSIGTVQLVATKQIPNISSGDVLYNIELDRLLKVTDFSYFRLKNGKVLGWNFTARPIQKDETLFNIYRMIK
jgi:hypothetical protein